MAATLLVKDVMTRDVKVVDPDASVAEVAAAMNRFGVGSIIVVAGGEPGAAIPSVRKKVEETFDCIFLEMMGNGDMCGQMWSECRYKRGMHFVAQGIVHPEIIDPASGKVVADVKKGSWFLQPSQKREPR